MTLEHLTSLMAQDDGTNAWERSAELRGLLGQIAREHGINRALMRQELAFLAHLTRLIGHEPEPGYRPPGSGDAPDPRAGAASAHPRHVVNYQA